MATCGHIYNRFTSCGSSIYRCKKCGATGCQNGKCSNALVESNHKFVRSNGNCRHCGANQFYQERIEDYQRRIKKEHSQQSLNENSNRSNNLDKVAGAGLIGGFLAKRRKKKHQDNDNEEKYEDDWIQMHDSYYAEKIREDEEDLKETDFDTTEDFIKDNPFNYNDGSKTTSNQNEVDDELDELMNSANEDRNEVDDELDELVNMANEVDDVDEDIDWSKRGPEGELENDEYNIFSMPTIDYNHSKQNEVDDELDELMNSVEESRKNKKKYTKEEKEEIDQMLYDMEDKIQQKEEYQIKREFKKQAKQLRKKGVNRKDFIQMCQNLKFQGMFIKEDFLQKIVREVYPSIWQSICDGLNDIW